MIKKDDERLQVTELVKNLFLAGLGAVFVTQENVKSHLSDLKASKELASNLFQNISKGKNEIVNSIIEEATKYLEKLDLKKELNRLLAENTINIQISLTPKKKKT